MASLRSCRFEIQCASIYREELKKAFNLQLMECKDHNIIGFHLINPSKEEVFHFLHTLESFKIKKENALSEISNENGSGNDTLFSNDSRHVAKAELEKEKIRGTGIESDNIDGQILEKKSHNSDLDKAQDSGKQLRIKSNVQNSFKDKSEKYDHSTSMPDQMENKQKQVRSEDNRNHRDRRQQREECQKDDQRKKAFTDNARSSEKHRQLVTRTDTKTGDITGCVNEKNTPEVEKPSIKRQSSYSPRSTEAVIDEAGDCDNDRKKVNFLFRKGEYELASRLIINPEIKDYFNKPKIQNLNSYTIEVDKQFSQEVKDIQNNLKQVEVAHNKHWLVNRVQKLWRGGVVVENFSKYILVTSTQDVLREVKKSYPDFEANDESTLSSTGNIERAKGFDESERKMQSRSVDRDKFELGSRLTVKVQIADITKLNVDVIVNAANGNLKHGGGVAKGIATAAGTKLKDECDRFIDEFGRISDSHHFASNGGRLNVKKVFHAVGPRWVQYGYDPELCKTLLRQTILRCLIHADMENFHSIVFPSISAAIFAVPKGICVESYMKAVKHFDKIRDMYRGEALRDVRFVDINKDMVEAVKKHFSSNWDNSISNSDQDLEKDRTMSIIYVAELKNEKDAASSSVSQASPREGRAEHRGSDPSKDHPRQSERLSSQGLEYSNVRRRSQSGPRKKPPEFSSAPKSVQQSSSKEGSRTPKIDQSLMPLEVNLRPKGRNTSGVASSSGSDMDRSKPGKGVRQSYGSASSLGSDMDQSKPGKGVRHSYGSASSLGSDMDQPKPGKGARQSYGVASSLGSDMDQSKPGKGARQSYGSASSLGSDMDQSKPGKGARQSYGSASSLGSDMDQSKPGKGARQSYGSASSLGSDMDQSKPGKGARQSYGSASSLGSDMDQSKPGKGARQSYGSASSLGSDMDQSKPGKGARQSYVYESSLYPKLPTSSPQSTEVTQFWGKDQSTSPSGSRTTAGTEHAAFQSMSRLCWECSKEKEKFQELPCCKVILCNDCDRILENCPRCKKDKGIYFVEMPSGNIHIEVVEDSQGNFRIIYKFFLKRNELIYRTTYIPATKDGEKVVVLLLLAFRRKLTFKPFKTDKDMGYTQNGIIYLEPSTFFDPAFLPKLLSELEQKGVNLHHTSNKEHNLITNWLDKLRSYRCVHLETDSDKQSATF